MYSNTVKLAQLIEQYSCFQFRKFLLDNYVPFLGQTNVHQVYF